MWGGTTVGVYSYVLCLWIKTLTRVPLLSRRGWEQVLHDLDMCAVESTPKWIEAKTAIPPLNNCDDDTYYAQLYPTSSFFNPFAIVVSIITIHLYKTLNLNPVCVVVQLTRCMLTDFKVLLSAIIFLAVAMPSISQYARRDPVYCFEALNHKNYYLAYCKAVWAFDVCVDVQAISSAWAPISTPLEVAELRSLHPDVASAPDHIVTSHPLNYSLHSRVNALPVQYSTVI